MVCKSNLNNIRLLICFFFIIDEKPYKLEVFEDSLYVTTYNTHHILRMDKFGRKNGTFLVQGLPRVSDILIIQENKQDKTSKLI